MVSQNEALIQEIRNYVNWTITSDETAELMDRVIKALRAAPAQCVPTEQIPVGYIVRNKETGAIASQHIVLNRPDAEAWANTFKPEWELQPVYLAANGYTLTSTVQQPVEKTQGGAWRKISADEAVKLKAEGASVDWIEGAGFVVYDAQALAETREQAARIAGVTSTDGAAKKPVGVCRCEDPNVCQSCPDRSTVTSTEREAP